MSHFPGEQYTALTIVKKRLGEKAATITWLEGDITHIDLPVCYYDLWHDRAVFHFLTTSEQRQGYLNNLVKSLRPGGHLIIATFSLEAPPKCSGLPVERYSVDQLKKVFDYQFTLKRYKKELHITPAGTEQMYIYCHFQKIA